ncbi:hypothetical protein QBC42DRAFT_260615 [Cladorrhinum samala]|uniref:Ribosomal protein S21 n=1 Tax=Cladorrhinum samala TaxID=585594 RepID=A0AAV9HYD2_9PEZI|nr:hypothetical protein QBC42DRAFT_260615 [Cladorrhinum samala]
MELGRAACRLAGARAFLRPSTSTPQQIRIFTSDSSPLSAAAGAAVASSPRDRVVFRAPSASQVRAESLREKLEARAQEKPLPPRPTPIPHVNLWTRPRSQQNSPAGAARSPLTGSDLLASIRSDVDRSTSNLAQGGGGGPATGMALFQISDFYKKHNMSHVEMRLRPSTGRTVSVHGAMDVARAFKVLEGHCRANNIKSESRQQKFHERPALKRKRLRRERWRDRFGAGFRATISRVMELRGQGW